MTGGTDGIGKAAARAFAQSGASVVLVGRNKAKTEQVLRGKDRAGIAGLIREIGNNSLDLIVGDLSSLAEVRDVGAQLKAKHHRLDVLVNNAGAMFAENRKSADGFELTFALNHLAYFQLTITLLDLIRNTRGSRVVSTASAAYRMGKASAPKGCVSRAAAWYFLAAKGAG